MTIIPRKGETRAEFKLQLVYKGLNIGSAKKVVWVEKDIQLHLTKLTKKLRGDNKQISFVIANQGKDDLNKEEEAEKERKAKKGEVEENQHKLFIRFSREKGHLATIYNKGIPMVATGAGFYEAPIGSENIGNKIENFTIIPRPGERKAQFKMQLVYEGKEMGKAETVTWTEKIIGLSIKLNSNVLRGHSDENTTIDFTIHRNRQGKTPENELEQKLRIRFKRQKGLATIVNTEKGEEEKGEKKPEKPNPGIFEYAMPSGKMGNPIKVFKIKPDKLDTEAIFSMELVYDGKTVGSAKKIKWTTEDIRPTLHIKNHTLRGKDNIIKFKVKNEGKDKLKQEDKNKQEKGDELKVMFKRKAGNATIATNHKASVNRIKIFNEQQNTCVLDNDHLNQYIDNLMVAYDSTTEPSKTESSEFDIQLFLNGFPVGKPETIYWENTFLEEEQERQEKLEKEQKRNEKRAQKMRAREELKKKEQQEAQTKTHENQENK